MCARSDEVRCVDDTCDVVMLSLSRPLSLSLLSRTASNFTSNVLTSTSGDAQAGGLRVQYLSDGSGSSVEVTDSRFDANQLVADGSAYGGGMLIAYFGMSSGARVSVAGARVCL